MRIHLTVKTIHNATEMVFRFSREENNPKDYLLLFVALWIQKQNPETNRFVDNKRFSSCVRNIFIQIEL